MISNEYEEKSSGSSTNQKLHPVILFGCLVGAFSIFFPVWGFISIPIMVALGILYVLFGWLINVGALLLIPTSKATRGAKWTAGILNALPIILFIIAFGTDYVMKGLKYGW